MRSLFHAISGNPIVGAILAASASSACVEVLHVSQVIPQERLDVSFHLSEVIQIVVDPFMQQFTDANRPDFGVNPATLQVIG